jgi:hypothetical protein
MSFGTQASYSCVSDITEPLPAFDLMTFLPYSGASSYTTDYEWASSSWISNGFGSNGYSTKQLSNTTTITSGIAVADPIVVEWQVKDMSAFPSAYASSLADRIGVTLEMSPATPAGSPSLPRHTNTLSSTSTPAPLNGLSTGAKAGIGVGVALVLILIGCIIVFFLLKKKQEQTTSAPAGADVAEMEDQDQTLASKKWYLFGKWRNEHAGEERTHELDSRTVNVIPGPPVELPADEPEQHEDPLETSKQ